MNPPRAAKHENSCLHQAERIGPPFSTEQQCTDAIVLPATSNRSTKGCNEPHAIVFRQSQSSTQGAMSLSAGLLESGLKNLGKTPSLTHAFLDVALPVRFVVASVCASSRALRAAARPEGCGLAEGVQVPAECRAAGQSADAVGRAGQPGAFCGCLSVLTPVLRAQPHLRTLSVSKNSLST